MTGEALKQTATADEAPAPEISNQVLEQQNRLEQAFSPESEQDVDLSFDLCLEPLLAALKWTGEHRRVSQARPHFEPIRDLDMLRTVLLRLGMRSKVARVPTAQLTPDQFPCIGITPTGEPKLLLKPTLTGTCLAFDPSRRDIVEIDLDQRQWTLCLFDATHREADPAPNPKRNWVWHSLASFKKPIAIIFVLTFLANMLALGTPIYVMNVYNSVITTKETITLTFFGLAICMALLLEIHLRRLRNRLLAYTGARFDAAIMTSGLAKIMALPINMIESASVGVQIMRLRQFESFLGALTGHLGNAILDLPFSILFFVAIGVIAGPIAWVPVFLAGVFALLAIISVPVTKTNVARSGRMRSESQRFLLEALKHTPTIRQLAAEPHWRNRMIDISREQTTEKFRAQFFDTSLHTIAQGLVMLAGVLTLLIGAQRVMENEMSVGALIAVMMFVWRVLSPIQVTFLSLNRIGQLADTARQINQLMRLNTERDFEQAPAIYRSFKGAVRFQAVSFKYKPNSEPALRGIDFAVEPGQIIGIPGPTASGKSTLLKAILGLYRPQAGAVFIDKFNLLQLDPGELRSALGYTPQTPLFFYGTIAQNLRLGTPEASDEDVRQALQDAGIDEADRQLPDGLQTRLTGRTVAAMTESMRQRLSLARAFVKKPSILLLDEPGAMLDFESDQALIATLRRLHGSVTVLMTTNRPSHLRICDRVIRLHSGAMVADGPPKI